MYLIIYGITFSGKFLKKVITTMDSNSEILTFNFTLSQNYFGMSNEKQENHSRNIFKFY